MDSSFLKKIELLQERLHLLTDWDGKKTVLLPQFRYDLGVQISSMVEELQVSIEELEYTNRELLKTRQELELEKKRYQELFELAPDGYLVTNLEGVIIETNLAAVQMLNVSLKYLIGKPLSVFIPQVRKKEFYNYLDKIRNQQEQSNSGEVWQVEIQPRGLNSLTVSVKTSPVKDANNKITGWRWLLHDITELHQVKAQLYKESRTDSLTCLPNRKSLLEFLEHLAQPRQKDLSSRFALLFLDVDHFKVINDSLGHEVGDELLIYVARRLIKCVRENDTVSRLGGDEFIIILDNINCPEYVENCVHRIQESFSQPFQINQQQLTITASIGVVISDGLENSASDLIRNADIAMYQAKNEGRACFRIFTPEMHTKAVKHLELKQELLTAWQESQFRVFYQPIVSLKDEQLVGLEALLRWEHPQRGIIAPAEFLSEAEQMGLIIPIGWKSLQEACLFLSQLQKKHSSNLQPLILNFNLSNSQFTQEDMVSRITTILNETGVQPESLELEITENVLMENIELAVVIFRELKNLGVRLAIDDFGTGFSSLGRLTQLPIDTVKIDRSFVAQMSNNPNDLEVVKVMINLAHQLKMKVIAEGIETSAQAKQLRLLRCDYGQGYFYGKPLNQEQTLNN